MSFFVDDQKAFRTWRLKIGLTATDLKKRASVTTFMGEDNWESNDNVFPGDTCPILSGRKRKRGMEKVLEVAHWGARFPGFRNAKELPFIKAEKLLKKPESYRKFPPCIRAVVFAQGCFLWGARPSGSGFSKLEADRRKQIYFMRSVDESELMPIAALRLVETVTKGRSRIPRQRVSFFIITRPLVANATVVPTEWDTHVRRQPLFLNADEIDDWIGSPKPMASFLDRRDPSKFQKLRVCKPLHVGFWVEDPEITDERVLKTRAEWDAEIESKTRAIEAIRKISTAPSTPVKATSQSSIPIRSSKKRSLSETKQEYETYSTDPLLMAAFANEDYSEDEYVPRKRQCIETVASAVSAESFALQRSDSSSSSLVLSDSESADATTNEEITIKIEDLTS